MTATIDQATVGMPAEDEAKSIEANNIESKHDEARKDVDAKIDNADAHNDDWENFGEGSQLDPENQQRSLLAEEHKGTWFAADKEAKFNEEKRGALVQPYGASFDVQAPSGPSSRDRIPAPAGPSDVVLCIEELV